MTLAFFKINKAFQVIEKALSETENHLETKKQLN